MTAHDADEIGAVTHAPLMRVLADFDRSSYCGTPLCGGTSGVDFRQTGDHEWMAETTCGCGSQSAYEVLADQEVHHLLSAGVYAILSLRRLIDALPHDLAVTWLAGRTEDEEGRIDEAIDQAEHALKVAHYSGRTEADS